HGPFLVVQKLQCSRAKLLWTEALALQAAEDVRQLLTQVILGVGRPHPEQVAAARSWQARMAEELSLIHLLFQDGLGLVLCIGGQLATQLRESERGLGQRGVEQS